MKRICIFTILSVFTAAILLSCVKENLVDGSVSRASKALDFNKIGTSASQSGSSFTSSVGGDTLSLSFCVPASSQATKRALEKAGKRTEYTCEVSVDSHTEGNNAMVTDAALLTKSIFGSNSTNPISCNFLRLDEDVDEDHTALYTFPTLAHAKLLEGEVTGAPENTSGQLFRSIVLKPEQSYKYHTQKFSESLTDTIFYHTRLIGWHPAVCSLPENGSPVEFGDTRYSNYRSYLSSRYGVVFDHALNGSEDLLMSTMVEGQRWHSPNAPGPGQRDNRYRDLAKQLFDNHYAQPLGYNIDQEPHYSNTMEFKHYLSAVRIWAKLDQKSTEEQSTLNLSTWGKILSLTFVDQPSTCTIMFPDSLGGSRFGKLLENSWTDYSNFNANPGLIYGEGDIQKPVTDYEVTYPIDMTKNLVEMEKKYLGYALVMPGADIVIAIQTSAGTYQATLPYKILLDGAKDSTELFQSGKIYDVVLNLETKGSVAEFIENEDTGNFIDLSPWDPSPDKQEFRTANCYMIDVHQVDSLLKAYQAEGSEDVPGYCFLGTVLGNGESGIMSKGITTFHTSSATIDSPTSAKLIWQSEKGLVSNVHLQHGYVRFNVANARKGNAVIAVLDESGTIVWSWHIWITDIPKVITSSKNYNYMDRNLGAITSTTVSGGKIIDGSVVPNDAATALNLYGLYYQWGRKDPLPAPLKYDQSGGQSMRITPVYNTYSEKVTSLGTYIYNQGERIQDGIEKPMHYILNPTSPYYNYNWTSDKIDFLWGEEVTSIGGSSYYQKTIYDPCPYGYHVPAEEIQYLAETADTIISSNPYGLFLEEDIFFPYAGYYGPDRNQTSNDGAAYYCGSKGDYQGSVICSDEDGIDYSYFRNHRLRTYISKAVNWTEQNIDDEQLFSYNAPYHHVTTDVVKTKHDYTNRCTAAPIRCIKETNYELNIVARMSMNTRAIRKDEDVPVTFTLEGRTNKGAISSAKLVIHYTDASSGAEITYKNIDLSDETVAPSAILTSKTLSGTCTVTIPSSVTSGAKEAEVYARLDLVVKQGSQEEPRSSVEYQLKDGFVLSLVMDADGSKGWIPAYCLDATETFTVKIPGDSLVTRNKPTTRLVKYNNMFPPVIGQPTTITVYVNSPDANVEIADTTATVDASKARTINGELHYPYSVSARKFTTKGWKTISITAGKDGYGTSSETLSLPVYGINVGSSKIDGSTTTRKAVTTNKDGIVENWYVAMDNGEISVSTDYFFFNGLNIHWTSSVGDYTYLIGFETTSGNTRFFNAMTGLNCPYVTGGESKLVVADTKDAGEYFYLSPITRTVWFRKTYFNHIKNTKSTTGYWITSGRGEVQVSSSGMASSLACAVWFYPVTFSIN